MLKELNQGFITPRGEIYVVALSKNFSMDMIRVNVIDTRTNERLPYDLNTKILIYEDRQKTWFFEIADCLKLMNEAGFILLMIGISYLEANQQFREGCTRFQVHPSKPRRGLRKGLSRERWLYMRLHC